MDYIMETVGLRKSYKGNVVVNDVNIHVPKGAIYGFVGPNGAGKSTVMKMILNLIQPEAGEVQLFGEKVTDQSYEVFKRVGSILLRENDGPAKLRASLRLYGISQ